MAVSLRANDFPLVIHIDDGVTHEIYTQGRNQNTCRLMTNNVFN